MFGALKNSGATLVGMVRTRLALVANELELARLQVMQQLAWLFGTLVCVAFGALLIVLLAALVWWEQRVWVVGGFAALFLLLAVFCYRAFKASAGANETLFDASLAELQKDLAELKRAVAEPGGRS